MINNLKDSPKPFDYLLVNEEKSLNDFQQGSHMVSFACCRRNFNSSKKEGQE